MAEAIVSAVLHQLTSTVIEEIGQEVRLVVDAEDKVEELKRKLRLIKAVLRDAEQKQLKEEAVGVWLDQFKDTAYDMEDVLDDWKTAMLKLNDKGGHEDALVSKKKVCRFHLSRCFGLRKVLLRHDIVKKIRKLNEKLDALETEKNKHSLNVIKRIEKQGREQTLSLDIDVSDICGPDTEKLSIEDSWLMFKRIAFSGRAHEEHERLDEIGKKIVEKCNGLPLAIKSIASLLRSSKTREKWEFILYNEMWELGEIKEGIFPALLLSYYDLPSEVKLCFLYCAIFPKNWKLDRNRLIFLWMAQGYFGSNQCLEMIGNECFNTLVARSFFQDVEKDYENDNVSCKMHDIIHDVAVFLSRYEYFTVESNDLGSHFNRNRLIRHLWERTPDLTAYSDIPKLRSLFLYDDSGIVELLPNSFTQFTHLKAFTFSIEHLKEIPKEIGRLRQLRFLDISKCWEVKELPDALYELYSLQTLIAPPNLERISEEIGKLVKLRHLVLDKYDLFNNTSAITPRGIGRLTSLRTLTVFVIDGGYDNKPCNLDCLKNMNHLRGHLSIDELGNITDSREVEKAELGNKKDLLELELDFIRSIGEKADDQNDLLEAIQPHPNLESLKIYRYKGSHVLPEWMMSLCKIKNLYLFNCNFGGRLPSLGKLPYLESLLIMRPDSVRRVSNEFLGIERGGESSSSSKVISFPKLKFLQFRSMNLWEVWDYGITRKDDEEFTIMPHLRTLKLLLCPMLKELPEDLFQRTTLEELEVDEDSSQILKERFEEWKMRRQAQRPSTSN